MLAVAKIKSSTFGSRKRMLQVTYKTVANNRAARVSTDYKINSYLHAMKWTLDCTFHIWHEELCPEVY